MTLPAISPILQALGWALLHSLWQGAVLALLAALGLRLARTRPAEFRYALAIITLGLLLLAFVGTLLWTYQGGAILEAAGAGMLVPMGEGQRAAGWFGLLGRALDPSLPWLVSGWGLGFSLRMVQVGRSLAWLYGPCLRSLQPASAEWQASFEALRLRSRVKGPVRFGLSDRIDTMMVLGWIRPVVMVPAAAILALSPEALEAVLAHELAHVRRGDFIANLMQTLAESVMFYHPAVWWLSRRIRQEREHCCDDAAVRTCGDPFLYASALAGLEELRHPPIHALDLAPAASGGRLMFRIQRLLQTPPPAAPAGPLAVLLPALVLVATLGAATLTATEAPKAPKTAPVDMDFKKVRVRHQPEAPNYPAEAKAARIQGTVVVVITIDTEGKVTEARAVSGPPELQPCAVAYARGWEFEPARVKGKTVAARFNLTMPFRLK